MLWFHPVLQVMVTLGSLYVLWLGLKRVGQRHLGKNWKFDWKKHVQIGKIVCVIWLMGFVGGVATTYIHSNELFIFYPHWLYGVIMSGLVLILFAMGQAMDKRKRKRKLLPVVHGVTGVLLMGLATIQVLGGIRLVQVLLLG